MSTSRSPNNPTQYDDWHPIKTAPSSGEDILIGWWDQFGVWVSIVAQADAGNSRSKFFAHSCADYWRKLPPPPKREE
jgi:hypothetical protein